MMCNHKKSGFTLIELLIVVVVIGILSTIAITILNPARQRLRARDATLNATIIKISLEIKAAANSDISGQGNYPTVDQLAGTVTTCAGATLSNVASCPENANTSFTITGITTGVSGTFTGFRYTSNGSTSFCISAPANDPTGGAFIRLNNTLEQTPTKQAAGC